MSPKKVIITRPITQARDFALKASANGVESVIFPLIDIHPIADQAVLNEKVRDLQQFSLVVFVSPNAIDAFLRHVSVWPREVPIAVMGAGSRHTLAHFGLTNKTATIISPANELKTDSETLLEVLDTASLSGKKVLIVRGTNGREFLSDALRSFDVDVQLLSAYQRVAPFFDEVKQNELIRLLESDNVWLITSSEALRTLMDWVRKLASHEFVAKMHHQEIIVPHVRSAETAQSLGFHFITLTASGDEPMLVALQSHV